MPQDMLGRGPFVSLLENIIVQKTNTREGFSFAIDGKWGCGKSWILKELEQKLELKNYLVIHYNCWENEYYEEPLVAILSVIIDKLNQLQDKISDTNKKDRIQIALKFFAEVISTILTNKFGIGFNEFLESGKNAIAVADLCEVVFTLDAHGRDFNPVALAVLVCVPVAARSRNFAEVDFGVEVCCELVTVIAAVAVENVDFFDRVASKAPP